MHLRLDRSDLKMAHLRVSIYSLTYRHFKPKVQKAIRHVGWSFYTDKNTTVTIRPPVAKSVKKTRTREYHFT